MRGLCLIGVSAAGGGQKRIAVAAAAAAGGHVLTLLQAVKAAALHMGRDVGAAVLTGARRCCHRDKSQRQHRRGRRCGHLQKLFHLVLPVWFKSERPRWDAGSVSAIDTRKKDFSPGPCQGSKCIVSRAY